MASMTKREKSAAARERRYEKERKREKLTNWYMINLCFGILGIILALIIRPFYYKAEALEYMPMAMGITAGVFVLAGVVLLILGACGVIKNKTRARHYAILMAVYAVGALWLVLYNKIRMYAEAALRAVTGNSNLSINSHWNIYILIIAIVVYLIISFIWYVIKLYRIK